MTVTSNIQTVIRQVRDYRSRLGELSREVVQRLIQEGEIVARSEAISLDAVYTGNLANSIDHFYDAATRTGFIRCNAEYGVFVEFGTGIMGQESPYPGTAMAEVGYHYGGGTTYVQTADGRVGWFFPGDGGKWYFTEGQPSRPFMYNTAQMMKRQVTAAARQVFANAR